MFSKAPGNVIARWMGRVGFHLKPLADRTHALIRESDRIFADETTLPTLAPYASFEDRRRLL